MNILLIEDEPGVASFISKSMKEAGYGLDIAPDGKTGYQFLEDNNYDLIILDLILPDINGLTICQKIRKDNKHANVPVLMLTALGGADHVATGLETGADDYLTKPFKFKELLARVRALHRRANISGQFPENILTFDNLEMNLDSKIVKRDNQEIQLTAREFTLLEFFMRNPNKVLSRVDILEQVWGIHFDLGTNVIDVYVNYLRNKIDKTFEEKLIHTMIGMGYVLRRAQ